MNHSHHCNHLWGCTRRVEAFPNKLSLMYMQHYSIVVSVTHLLPGGSAVPVRPPQGQADLLAPDSDMTPGEKARW